MMIKYSISLGRGFSICFSQVRIISYLVNLNDFVKRDATDATDATDPEALEDDAIPQARTGFFTITIAMPAMLSL